MTPTNEAGHGLPEVAAAREVIRAYFAGELDDTMILSLSEALALSRGVPPDMVLVPREPTEAMQVAGWCAHWEDTKPRDVWAAMIAAAPNASLGETASQERARLLVPVLKRSAESWGNHHCASELTRAIEIIEDLLSDSAPAAAGAPGVEYAACCDTPAYCSSVRRCTRMDSTPQPAAADGGVRERDLLADAIAQAGIKCGLLRPDIEGLTGPQLLMVCQDMVDALSSHRQAGDGLSKFKELAERWQKELDRSGVSNDEYNYGFDVAKSGCLYEMKSILALVEKGAGNG